MAVDSVRGSRRLTGFRSGVWSSSAQQVPENGRGERVGVEGMGERESGGRAFVRWAFCL